MWPQLHNACLGIGEQHNQRTRAVGVIVGGGLFAPMTMMVVGALGGASMLVLWPLKPPPIGAKVGIGILMKASYATNEASMVA